MNNFTLENVQMYSITLHHSKMHNYPVCTVYLGWSVAMVDSSCCVIDGIVGICAVGHKHEVDFICSPIQVLKDASSVVKTNAKVDLCVHVCVCVCV